MQLRKHESEEAFQFYFFMGLLPGGCSLKALEVMWGPTVAENVAVLRGYGFLEGATDKVLLKSYCVQYAEEATDLGTKEKF